MYGNVERRKYKGELVVCLTKHDFGGRPGTGDG